MDTQEIQKEEIPLYQGDLQLTATLPNEMMVAQNHLIQWCDGKMASLRLECDELKAAYEHAKKNKWKFSVLQSQYNKSVKKVSYYEKIKAALEAGYVIIPNFPVDMFAIRTDKGKPKKYLNTYWNENGRNVQEVSDMALTVGEYKNPRPTILSQKIDDKTSQYWAEDWKDEIDFPLNMAKPLIMQATSNAMALKIFDRFGVMPSTRRDDDPVIIGQILNKRGPFQTKIVSFMIAWHLNTNVL